MNRPSPARSILSSVGSPRKNPILPFSAQKSQNPARNAKDFIYPDFLPEPENTPDQTAKDAYNSFIQQADLQKRLESTWMSNSYTNSNTFDYNSIRPREDPIAFQKEYMSGFDSSHSIKDEINQAYNQLHESLFSLPEPNLDTVRKQFEKYGVRYQFFNDPPKQYASAPNSRHYDSNKGVGHYPKQLVVVHENDKDPVLLGFNDKGELTSARVHQPDRPPDPHKALRIESSSGIEPAPPLSSHDLLRQPDRNGYAPLYKGSYAPSWGDPYKDFGHDEALQFFGLQAPKVTNPVPATVSNPSPATETTPLHSWQTGIVGGLASGGPIRLLSTPSIGKSSFFGFYQSVKQNALSFARQGGKSHALANAIKQHNETHRNPVKYNRSDQYANYLCQQFGWTLNQAKAFLNI